MGLRSKYDVDGHYSRFAARILANPQYDVTLLCYIAQLYCMQRFNCLLVANIVISYNQNVANSRSANPYSNSNCNRNRKKVPDSLQVTCKRAVEAFRDVHVTLTLIFSLSSFLKFCLFS